MVKNVKPSAVIGSLHQFSTSEIAEVRGNLLKWYDKNHRVLPWRTIAATEDDRNRRVYAVWVSEIMLQQTQVATVISYFEKWMKKWPTVGDLASATLEDVNKVWAGLGYYSRARRLHEGAQKVSKDLNCEFPPNRETLIEQLPGVGRYSGSAIASIALGSVVGVVDGNVSRVMARLRAVGADISSQTTMDHIWDVADMVVDPNRPGDFNQALMELGATVCTPKTPNCESCPLKRLCVAYEQSGKCHQKTSIANHFKKEVKDTKDEMQPSMVSDIECVPNCDLCLPKEDWNNCLGVQNYPRKAQSVRSREETSAVVVLRQNDGQMLLVQRPKTGLLANLWEFPHIDSTSKEEHWDQVVMRQLKENFSLSQSDAASLTFVSDVLHIFSHIRQTYRVYKVYLKDKKLKVSWPERYQGGQWMTREEFLSSATSTAMKKVLKAVDASEPKTKGKKTKRKDEESPVDPKKQRTISQFFTKSKPKSE